MPHLKAMRSLACLRSEAKCDGVVLRGAPKCDHAAIHFFLEAVRASCFALSSVPVMY
jgi:hypothetical protein